jgi:hypothetical protein
LPRKQKKPLGRHQLEVHRFFRGLPVVDATEPLRVVVNKTDIRTAKRLDPNNCVFAQACRRLFNSHAVLFLRRTAYVELPDSRGRRVVNRFKITPTVFDRIVKFDKTGEADEGGFLLKPPVPSQRIEAHAAYAKRYRRELYEGKRTVKATRPNKRYQKGMLGVRDGRGKLGINYAF